jgi:hypothetical protein
LTADASTDSNRHRSLTTTQVDQRGACTASFAAIPEDDVDELIILLARYCAESLFRAQFPCDTVTDDP